jgi:hypothetical protein
MATPECTTISFSCAGCGKAFSVSPSLAGRKAKCKVCGHSVLIPEADAGRVGTPPVGLPNPTRPVPPKLPPRDSSLAAPFAGGHVLSEPQAPSLRNEGLPASGPSLPVYGEVSRGAKGRSLASHQGRSSKPATSPSRHFAIIVAIVLAGSACVAAVMYRPQLTQHFGAVARSASRVVPAARALSPVRVITQEEVDAVIRQTSLNDISSKNVYQQMATFSRGAMKMSSLVALSYGAAAGDIDGKLRAVDIAEIGTKTVHQQKAVYLEGMQILLAAAARASGVADSKVEAVLSQVRISDIGSKTVHQQCANYCSGCLKLAELLASTEGVSSDRIGIVMSDVRTNDVTADTVHQQNVAYLSGLAQMLALAAASRGAANSETDAVLREMRLADIGAKTVFQQEVNALVGVMKLLGLLAVGT